MVRQASVSPGVVSQHPRRPLCNNVTVLCLRGEHACPIQRQEVDSLHGSDVRSVWLSGSLGSSDIYFCSSSLHTQRWSLCLGDVITGALRFAERERCWVRGHATGDALIGAHVCVVLRF